tara:strand:- start:4255 stop:5199 length:945 start_codon:yes stop_codon:yes gene_type:complete
MRLSIVAQGGTMRGAWAVGALKGLRSLGLYGVDRAVGESASAGNFAYSYSGQFNKGYRIWNEFITRDEFCAGFWNVGELMKARKGKRHYVDVDWLVDEVFGNSDRALDLNKLRTSRVEIIVPLTNVVSGRPERVDLRKHDKPLEVLRAAMALPVAYEGVVNIDGVDYSDSGLSDSFPVNAIDYGDEDRTVFLATGTEEYGTNFHHWKQHQSARFFGWLLKNPMDEKYWKLYKRKTAIFRRNMKKALRIVDEERGVVIEASAEINEGDNSSRNIEYAQQLGFEDAVNSEALQVLLDEVHEGSTDEQREFYFTPSN